MSKAERMSIRRRRLLLTNAIAFAAWQAGQLAIFSELARGLAIALTLTSALVWFTTLLMALKVERDRATQAVLEDELTHHNRYRAVHWGFWTMIITAGAALALASFIAVSAIDVARVVLVAGVSSALIRFAMLERPDGSE